MSTRAAEMAKAMMEEWPEGESAKSFALRLFYNDTLDDLKKAVAIMEELEEADENYLDAPHRPGEENGHKEQPRRV